MATVKQLEQLLEMARRTVAVQEKRIEELELEVKKLEDLICRYPME